MMVGCIIPSDDAQTRTAIVAMAAICQNGYELLHHLPDSVDLAIHLTYVCSNLLKIHFVVRHLRVMKISSMLKMTSLKG